MQLRQDLRQTGLTLRAIDAAWPDWWSNDVVESPAVSAELRYTLARRLGLSPASLFDGQPTFVWRDEAKYKRLQAADRDELGALTSFGMALGRMLINASPSHDEIESHSPQTIRDAILAGSAFVSLGDLLALCWSLGIPVVHAQVRPLRRKRMHAMTVCIANRYAILLGQASPFASQLAYTIAHELGHIFLGHVAGSVALVELGDPITQQGLGGDPEEAAADAFALSLLTGSPNPTFATTITQYNANELADAALATGPGQRIDPGVLALCVGHSTGRWQQTFAALKQIPPGKSSWSSLVNELAASQLDLSELPDDSARYVRRTLGVPS